MARSHDTFTTIHSEGALLPPDFLQRIVADAGSLDGLTPDSYHLPGQRLNEAISQTWNRLQGAWASFKAARERLPEGDLGTSITRDRWLLPLFAALDYGRLETAHAVEIDGKSYSISHCWRNVPIHLLGCNVSLDHRTPRVAGAARATPHGLLQVYLNRSKDTLWGFLSNGLRLRILRDNVSLTRQAYVDFDLEAMMEGEVYADFVLLYLLCHQSRVEGEKPGDFWLEKWMNAAQQQDIRVLDQMQKSVKQAIERLGVGFIDHPANHALREALQTGALSTQDYYRQLLRLVYRLLFLFAAEDRNLLHPDKVDELLRQRYHDYYSTRRLREMAGHIKGTRHHDLFDSLRLITRLLSGEAGYSDEQRAMLGLPALDGWLFREEAVGAIIGYEIANRDLLDAVRALAFTEDPSARVPRPVDYRNLGPEELGSVYEWLLELHPKIHIEARAFSLDTAAGHERKTTGSYYTPDSLVQALLDSALDPVIDEARRAANPKGALLNLKICDPACGSGHFLIAAARRIANALATVETGEEEPPPEALRHAVREVIGQCIYGVDINPLAVELCKVNLWMESLEPGMPLSFLEHRILCGNSLLGTTPALIAQGIPDEAFNPIEGDDRDVVSGLRKRNREERNGQLDMFILPVDSSADAAALSRDVRDMHAIPDSTLDGVWARERRYAHLKESVAHCHAQMVANAWCAAFVWEKRAAADPNTPPPITNLVFRQLADDGGLLDKRDLVEAEVARLAEQYKFLHWHIAFPDVFNVPECAEDAENTQTGWNGGFDCVLGNPPWERIKIQEKEWFAEHDREIAAAPNAAARQRMIEQLIERDPYLLATFRQDRRKSEGESHFVLKSGRYPLCGRGDVNTYAIFAETNRHIVSVHGNAGFIVQSDIATSDTYRHYFEDLMHQQQLVSFFDFVNTEGLFPGIHRTHPHFCLLTIAGSPINQPAQFAFWNTNVGHLNELERHFTLSLDDIMLVNPNTHTSPIFRSRHDADLTKAIYRRVSVLISEDNPLSNLWNCNITRTFDMARFVQQASNRTELEHAGLHLANGYFAEDAESWCPIIEAKTFWQFDHRMATYEDVSVQDAQGGNARPLSPAEKEDPFKTVIARYWLPSEIVSTYTNWHTEGYWLAYRDITNTTNERTMIAAILPKRASDYTVRLIYSGEVVGQSVCNLTANLNSFVFDYVSRQSVAATHFSDYVMKQLAVLPPSSYDAELAAFITPHILELTYTAWDLQPFAQDVGYNGPPFIWDEDRRFLMRCELDALYFHLYQIAREDVDYIMETFPIVKRRDEQAYGEYRTKRVILQMYDQMAALPKMSVTHPKGLDEEYLVPDVSEFQTWLTPPPADPSVAHPEQ